MAKRETCAGPCGRPNMSIVAGGLCGKCYLAKRKADGNPLKPKTAVCTECNETKPIVAKGLCRSCYDKKKSPRIRSKSAPKLGRPPGSGKKKKNVMQHHTRSYKVRTPKGDKDLDRILAACRKSIVATVADINKKRDLQIAELQKRNEQLRYELIKDRVKNFKTTERKISAMERTVNADIRKISVEEKKGDKP